MTSTTTTKQAVTEALGKFFYERRSWFRVEIVDNGRGGEDIVVRIDGTYFGHPNVGDIRDYFAECINDALSGKGTPT